MRRRAGAARAGARREMSVRLRVNPIQCIAHGLCAELLPEHIALDEWGYPIVDGKPVDPAADRPRAARGQRVSDARAAARPRRRLDRQRRRGAGGVPAMFAASASCARRAQSPRAGAILKPAVKIRRPGADPRRGDPVTVLPVHRVERDRHVPLRRRHRPAEAQRGGRGNVRVITGATSTRAGRRRSRARSVDGATQRALRSALATPPTDHPRRS